MILALNVKHNKKIEELLHKNLPIACLKLSLATFPYRSEYGFPLHLQLVVFEFYFIFFLNLFPLGLDQ